MRRLVAALVFLALPLATGCGPVSLPGLPDYRILHTEVRAGHTRAGAPVVRVVAQVLVQRGRTPQRLQRSADGAIARLRKRYGAAAVTLHITDTELNLPFPGLLGVVYWEPQGTNLYDLDPAAPPTYSTDYRWAQKVTDPAAVARPSDEALTFTSLWWRLRSGGSLSSAEQRRMLAHVQRLEAEQLLAEVQQATIWMQY